MITHFAKLELNTVSIEGMKQFYQDQMHFPVVSESQDEISFQPTEYFTLSFKESEESMRPAHIAFQVPFSEFEHVVDVLKERGITLLKWSDGRIVNDYSTGKAVYFRDGDGNLLEMIAHSYVKEDIVTPSGDLKILYLREIGFPIDDCIVFSEWMVQLFDFKLASVSDDFRFAIGGTAHAVIPSKKRKWIPIAMTALQPSMIVTFGVSSTVFIQEVKSKLDAKAVPHEWKEDGWLYFTLHGYHIVLTLTNFPVDVPARLNLPFSIM
ncbi:VOC family protein [Paenibacillus alginolyticus]|uniref:Glyoxalase/bleomycin resistance/dioxygenase family protein n=1 Tax=Paenibacillus alginolyticus TaxID=59839 RepID=A0ABT4GPF0_9BACL|nr:glyoxalase/bleomycin resistance/dioxygenase family protein [Paenibacillus alginolyticus]MCY9698102.1 glyoxalase/bleomycin resistance/dioxygenase family protein [Paenibacillus alginolyticus]MEC0148692.1 glyoxalase/bleomycin resistance/dioxygenase family protein [Paenibacillus alginolyticus]